MAATATVTIERLDHFGMPTNDLLRAEEFYTQVLEGVVAVRNGLTTRHRQTNLPPLFFIDIGHHRLGLHLQREFLPSVDAVRGLPSFAFEFAPAVFERIVRRLRERDVPHEGPVQQATVLGPMRLVYFLDPDGNHLEACTSEQSPVPADEPLLRRMELESRDLDRSERFYTQGLGMRVAAHGTDFRGGRELTLQGHSDQFLVLHEVATLSRVHGRRWWGPHYAIHVRPEDFEALLDQVERYGVQLIDHRPVPRRIDEGDIYFDDPDGNVIQLETTDLQEPQRTRSTWRSEHPWPDR
jgi:catechol 2,3-dioxygenase-like lactoylglutathione lyase family enzyme